ncbi:uncharacterized protein RJT21DRAFT_27946 [Scheffersomyces amazonensis]|uniref:uncharacterized protein n=1 Tax=Scheffersomyces amazonensis TaxID=1078765 RepID=UPI00315CAEE9
MSFGSSAAQRLANKTILITGASAGIGKATAYEFADASNGEIKLILTARRLDKLSELAHDLLAKYPKLQLHVVDLDVSKLETIPSFISNLPKDFADIDVLVNNAGLALGKDPVGQILPEDIQQMFQTNVLGLITLTQAVLPILKAKNSGDIVNLGSIAGRDPYPGGGIYCSTKAAVKSFSHVLRKELINTKIRVIEVDPGNVETDFSITRFKGDVTKAKDVYKGTEPLIGEDIAEIIVFAVSRRQNTVIAETLVFATNQASATHLYRNE